MKIVKINTDHYVIVDDSEIKEGDYVFLSDEIYYVTELNEDFIILDNQNMNSHIGVECERYKLINKITHSTEPIEEGTTIHGIEHKRWNHVKFIDLSEVKELLGEVDVERKAELYVWGRVYLTEQEKQQTEIAYMTGYNQAIQDNKDKKYTEEDLSYLLNLLTYDDLAEDEKIESCTEYIKDLLQPKTEWEVEYDENGKLKLV